MAIARRKDRISGERNPRLPIFDRPNHLDADVSSIEYATALRKTFSADFDGLEGTVIYGIMRSLGEIAQLVRAESS